MDGRRADQVAAGADELPLEQSAVDQQFAPVDHCSDVADHGSDVADQGFHVGLLSEGDDGSSAAAANPTHHAGSRPPTLKVPPPEQNAAVPAAGPGKLSPSAHDSTINAAFVEEGKADEVPPPEQNAAVLAAGPGELSPSAHESTIDAAFVEEGNADETVLWCPVGHTLLPYCVVVPTVACYICGDDQTIGTLVRRCRVCEFHVCELCLAARLAGKPFKSRSASDRKEPANVLDVIPEDFQAMLDVDAVMDLERGRDRLDVAIAKEALTEATLKKMGLSVIAGVRDEHVKCLVVAGTKLHYLGFDGCIAIIDDAIRAVATHCRALDMITMDDTDVTDAAVVALALGCPDLKSVSVKRCAGVTDEGVISLAEGCKKLISVQLEGTSISDRALEALGMGRSGLTSLGLGDCAGVTDAGVLCVAHGCSGLQRIRLDRTSVTDVAVKALVKFCPELWDLHLGGCAGMTDAGVLCVAKGCLGLRNIGLDNTSVTDGALEALGKGCPGLLYLDLSGCARVTSDGVLHVVQGCRRLGLLWLDGTACADGVLGALGRRCPNLRALSLKGCAGVTDAGVVQVAAGCLDLHAIGLDGTACADGALSALGQGCPNLRDVSLKGCAHVTDAGVVQVAQGCPGLERIGLDGTAVADRGVAALARHCPRLTMISRDGCTDLADCTVFLLAERCLELQYLDLSGCPTVTDVSAGRLLGSLPHLRVIWLGGCAKVTDASFGCLPKHLEDIALDGTSVSDRALEVLGRGCPGLRGIHLKGCANVTDAGLVSIAQGCRSLQYIELDNTSVGDDGVMALAQHCQGVKHLRLESCSGVTDRSVSLLAERCRKLEFLNLNDCPGVTDISVRLLAGQCMRLGKLALFGCVQVSDASVALLLEQSQTIKAINLERTGVDCDTVQSLARRYPNVQIVHSAVTEATIRPHLEPEAASASESSSGPQIAAQAGLPAAMLEAMLQAHMHSMDDDEAETFLRNLMSLADKDLGGPDHAKAMVWRSFFQQKLTAHKQANLVHATDALGMRNAMLLVQPWWRSILTKRATAFKGARRPQLATHAPPSAPLRATFLESEELRGCPSCSRASILAVLPGRGDVLLLGCPSPCRFDAAARLWRPLPAHPHASLSMGCVVPGSGGEPDKVVCFGREGHAFVLDTSTWSWEEEQAIARHPPARRLSAAVAVGTAVWLIGGDTMSQGDILGPPLNDVWSFDMSRPPPKRWLELSPSGNRFPPRSAHSATFVDSLGKVCLFGGSDGDQVLDDLWVVDIAGPSGLRCYPVRPAGTRPPPMAGHIAVSMHTPSPTVLFWGGRQHEQEPLNGVFALDADTFWWAPIELIGGPSGGWLVVAAPFRPAEVLVFGGAGDNAGGAFGTIRVDPEDFEVRLAKPCAAAMVQSDDELVVLYVPAGATDESILQEVRVRRLSDEDARCSGLRGDRRSHVYELLPDHVHFRQPVMLGMLLAAGPEGQSSASRWRCASVGGARILHAASLAGDWEVLACTSHVDAQGCWIWAEMAHFCFVCVECCYPLHSINARSSGSQVLVDIDLHTANKRPEDRNFWHVFEKGPWGDPFKNGQTFTLGVRGGKARRQVTRWVHEPMTKREPTAGVCDHMDRPTSGAPTLEVLRDGKFMTEYDLGLFNLPGLGVQRAIPVGALIIGNSAYRDPLPQAIVDADCVQERLSAFDFRQTLSYRDASKSDLLEAFCGLVDCMREARQACPDGSCLLCFFYYAGHAIQQNGDICLLPAGVPAEASPEHAGGPAEPPLQVAVPLSRLILLLNGLGNSLSSRTRLVCVYVHDACLDDPTGDANGTYFNKRPTTKVPSPQPALPELWKYRKRTFQSQAEHLHLLACDPGRVAAERKGGGRGSWVAEALVEHLRWNADLQRVFEDVRTYVVDESEGTQRPWICACMSSRGVYLPDHAPPLHEGVAGQSALSCGHRRESLQEECGCCRAYCQMMDAKAEAASTVAQSSASSSGPEEGQASAQSGLPSAEPASSSAPQPAQQAQHPRTWLLGLLPFAVAVPCALLQGGATFELLRPAFRAPAQFWIRWLSRGPERA